MNRALFCLIVNVLFLFQWAEVNAQQRHIAWSGVSKMNLEEGVYHSFLYMESATYTDSLPSIPFYFEIHKMTPGFDVKVQVVNPVFESLTEEEHEILVNSGVASRDIYSFVQKQYYRREPLGMVYVFPFRVNPENGLWERLTSFEFEFEDIYNQKNLSGVSENIYAAQSVLATGNWYKLCVRESGLYKITQSDLEKLGVNVSSLNPRTLKIFGNGGAMLSEQAGNNAADDLVEYAIYVEGEANGAFGPNDYILFYGEQPGRWFKDGASGGFAFEPHLYATENCYYLNVGGNNGKRVGVSGDNVSTPDQIVTSFDERLHHERDLYNLVTSGKVWFGEVFELNTEQSFSFFVKDIVSGSPLKVKTNLASRSGQTTRFNVQIPGRSKDVFLPGVTLSASTNLYATVNADTLIGKAQSENFNVKLQYYRTGNASKGWLDYITVNARKNLIFRGGQMEFRDLNSVGVDKSAEFRLSNVASGTVVWDITQPWDAKRMSTQASSGLMSFRANTSSLREFVVFDGTSYKQPITYGLIPNQNLHGLQVHDLFIVVPPVFLSQANTLADFRRNNDNLTVKVVTTEEVYNEFSAGKPDISAIRNFMKMFYDRANNPEELPRYLLLFGNGTIDNRNLLGLGANHIPTFQTLNSWNPAVSFTTDDFFGMLDDGEGREAFGVLDIGVGRFPVKNPNEADMVVDKVIRYSKRFDFLNPMQVTTVNNASRISNFADWRNVICIIADDEDTNIHIDQADRIARKVTQQYPVFNLDKIYLDAYQQVNSAGGERYPDVNIAITNRVNLGALLVNYIGHGGFNGLAKERIVTFSDINNWNNYYNLPVFLTATCEFSAFDHPGQNEISAGVQVFLKPNGGASALLTTTRLAYSGSNFTLNQNFMETVFELNENGEYHRIGDLLRIAKVKSSSADALKNFVLLGDPSMMMAYPRYTVVTESVSDTLSALNKITVTGYVADLKGKRVSGYNGILYPTVYDKFQNYTTLANDKGSQPFDFKMQSRILYRGKVSVTNGQFSFSFIVPKDIIYSKGYGKISYYLDNGVHDGSGYYDEIVVGGSAESFEVDFAGPRIELFINDLSFKSGGETDQNPILIALLKDESGINTTGELGHDIIAVLNETSNNPYVLNHYYQADLDSYTSGRIIYPFYNLPDGLHTLSLRAWDIHNNPSVESIEFLVSSSAQLALSELLNYPNPITNSGTNFTFVHNFPFTELDVTIEVFSLQGRLLKTLETQILTPGFKSQPIPWDGIDESGNHIGNGMYVYRLSVSLPDGRSSELVKKLVVLR